MQLKLAALERSRVAAYIWVRLRVRARVRVRVTGWRLVQDARLQRRAGLAA